MAEVASTVPGVSEPLTWFRSARVAGHGKRRRDPLEQARPLQAQYSAMAHLFTGRIRLPLSPLLLA